MYQKFLKPKSAKEIYAELAESRECYDRGEYEDFDDALDDIYKKCGLVPKVVKVIPNDNYIVEVTFDDGKIVYYDVNHLLQNGCFKVLADEEFYKKRCTIMNDTLAWDISGKLDPSNCLDIDPLVLYNSI